VLAFVRYHTHHALPVAAFLGMSVMFTSTLWRMYKVDALPGSRSAFRASLTSTLIALVPICLLAYSFETVFAENWHRYLLCYYLSIALFLAGTSILKITSPLLALIGEASYGIYLFSAFINMGFERLVPLSISRVISLQGYVLIEIIMSCLVCIFVHYTFEKPMIRVGRSVAERLVGKRKQTVMSSHASGC